MKISRNKVQLYTKENEYHNIFLSRIKHMQNLNYFSGLYTR